MSRALVAIALLVPALALAQPPAQDGYLVAPFENASSVKGLDWMAPALATTIAEKLEEHPQLRAAYGPAPLDGWPAKLDEAKAAERARGLGARFVVAGSFARPNWRAEVKVRLLEVVGGDDGKPAQLQEVASSDQIGERQALFDLVDAALLDVLGKAQLLPDGDALAQIKRRPTRDLYAFTLFGRAQMAYYGLGQPQDLALAEKTLVRVIRIDPKLAEAHRLLGLVYVGKGDLSRAASQYNQALDIRPDYYAPLVGLARLYRQENRRQPALEMATRALEARPGDVEMRYQVGELEWESGDLDKSLADLLVVVKAAPGHVPAHRALAQVYAARNETKELADELGHLAQLVPDDLDVRLDLAAAWTRLGDHPKAIAAYEEVLKHQPKNLQALKFSGDLYRRTGEYDKAVVAYQKLRFLAPDDPRPVFLLGATYAEMGNDGKAEQVLQDAQQFRRHLGEAWTDLGAIAYRRGDLPTANWYLSRAVERAPMRPKAHYNYALVLDATKQRDKALAELRTASELDPEDADCHYLAGVIYLRLGKLDEAKGEFEAALKRRPDHADAQHNLSLLEDLEKRYGAEHSARGAE